MPKGSVCWLSASIQLTMKPGYLLGLLFKCEKCLLERESSSTHGAWTLQPDITWSHSEVRQFAPCFEPLISLLQNEDKKHTLPKLWNNMWICRAVPGINSCATIVIFTFTIVVTLILPQPGLSWWARGFCFNSLTPVQALPYVTWLCKTTLLCWDPEFTWDFTSCLRVDWTGLLDLCLLESLKCL